LMFLFGFFGFFSIHLISLPKGALDFTLLR